MDILENIVKILIGAAAMAAVYFLHRKTKVNLDDQNIALALNDHDLTASEPIRLSTDKQSAIIWAHPSRVPGNGAASLPVVVYPHGRNLNVISLQPLDLTDARIAVTAPAILELIFRSAAQPDLRLALADADLTRQMQQRLLEYNQAI